MGNDCYEWGGNEFYDVVMMKIKYNWMYNWTVSFMETKKLAKSARKTAENST